MDMLDTLAALLDALLLEDMVDKEPAFVNGSAINLNFSDFFMQLTAARSQKSHRPLALVADDSLITRRALAQVVSDFGMEVHTAKDGFEAVDMMRDKVPDIVLLDMAMPRLNGLELTAHIRSN